MGQIPLESPMKHLRLGFARKKHAQPPHNGPTLGEESVGFVSVNVVQTIALRIRDLRGQLRAGSSSLRQGSLVSPRKRYEVELHVSRDRKTRRPHELLSRDLLSCGKNEKDYIITTDLTDGSCHSTLSSALK